MDNTPELRKQIGSRIKSRRENLGLTQPDLAKLCGWIGQSRISNYENGRRMPEIPDFIKIANALQTTPQFLQFGESAKNNFETENIPLQNQIPIIEWSALEKWTGNIIMEIQKEQQSEISPKIANPHNIKDGFVLVVKDNSMIDPNPNAVSFSKGQYVTIDPHKKPEHEKYVIAIVNGEGVLRQYIVSAGKASLRATTPNYCPNIEVTNDIKIIGCVVAGFDYFYKDC